MRQLDPTMPDIDIIRLAAKEERIIITMDKDFGELVYHSSMQHAGILLLRLDDATGIEKAVVIKRILKNYASQLDNSFTVYQNDKCRIRKMKASSNK